MTRWFTKYRVLFTMIVVLLLPLTLAVVQAQDGGTGSGQRISAHFVLQVNTSDPKLRRLCVGETVRLPVTVALRTIEFTGAGETGDWTVHGVQLDPDVGDESIVTAAAGGSFGADGARAPFLTTVNLTGVEQGSTTITLNATVQSDITHWLDGEVALPIPITSRADPISVPARVIYCDFLVSISTVWDTSMHGARTVLIANARRLRLAGGGNGPTLRFDPPVFGAPFLEWTWANNRIIGCLASGGNFSSRAPTIVADLRENNIAVTIDFARAVPGGPTSAYYWNLCLPHFTAGTSRCEERPDGYCWTMENPIGDWFEPQRLVLVFGLEGETQSATHLINHSWGSANGTTLVTLTPVRVQQ